MIPPNNEFPVSCKCNRCGYETEHWVNFEYFACQIHRVLATLQCEVCENVFEARFTEEDFEMMQLNQQFPNPN